MNEQDKYTKGGIDYQPGRMQKSFDQWVEEERQEHHMGDETTEGEAPSGTGVVNEVVPEPGMKPASEIMQNPNEVLDGEVMARMSAKTRFAMDHEQAKHVWESVTSGATHKIGACMKHFKGKVSDEGAFCNFLAQQAGYKPE